MPRYFYRCDNCKHQFETVHSIKENLDHCEECDTKDALKRVPFPIRINKKGTQKAGNIVKDFIKETTEEIKEEKKNLKKKEFKT
jgi:putative FmdB family regulatory protein